MIANQDQKIAAFFDLDDTLVVGTNTLLLYVKYLVKMGEMKKRDIVKGVMHSLLHKLLLTNVEKLLDNFAKPYAGKSAAAIWALVDKWLHQDVVQHIANEAAACIQWHHGQGHLVVLLSNASQFICDPIAKYLEMDHVLCTEAEIIDGVLSGKLKKPLCYQEGKVLYAQRFAKTHHVDLAQSYFYTDSISDLPMLKVVQNPIVVNPDPLLKRHAKKYNWPIYRWTKKKSK